MTLQEQLASIKAKSAAMVTPQVAAAMRQSYDELKSSKLLERALKAGDKAPAFVLPNSEGQMIHSSDLLRQGPLVILFYRGKW
jgi:hypothetical protein